MKAHGFVSLVGAGPGDPELITLRGRSRLASADVVIHDHLAGREVLGFCSESCEKIDVGKRCGDHSAVQERIIELLLEHARAGRNVVRLKGGDPVIFGRGGEELEALMNAGIPCEVVPGVTAACASGAAAGISLTHRDLASAVVFITGHEDPKKPGFVNDWAAFARLNATLCIYMGGRRLAGITSQLLAGGMSSETPVALVSRASWPDQRIQFLTLAGLPDVDPARMAFPTLAIIGEVARHPAQVTRIASANNSR